MVTARRAVTAGQNGTAEIVSAIDGPHTLTVWSMDKASNISPAASYRFFIGVSAGNVTGPVTGEITAAKTVLRAAGHTSTSLVDSVSAGDVCDHTAVSTRDTPKPLRCSEKEQNQD